GDHTVALLRRAGPAGSRAQAQRAHSGAGPAGASGSGAPLRSHRPELPRRWEPSRWVSTIPIASIRANMVVGPTKRKPRRLSSAASAIDSAEVVGTSSGDRGAGLRPGR